MMDDTLFEQAVRLTAPPTDTGLSWRPLPISDGDELYVDGVCRGEVIRTSRPGNYHEPNWWSAQSMLTGWKEGRARTRLEAAQKVERIARKWLLEGSRHD